MAGGESNTGERIHVLCAACGKPWPATLAHCPDDGSALSRRAGLFDVHVQETMILAGRDRSADDAPGAEQTQVDLAALDSARGEPRVGVAHVDSAHRETGRRLAADDPGHGEPRTFHATDTEEATGAAAPRLPALIPDASFSFGSSDPRTGFVRRYADHIELPPGSVVDDEYEIEARLGAGAMGVVYAARHLKLGKLVAIKVIAPRLGRDTEAVARFAQEARTLAWMHHPGLVEVLGFGELADGRAYFVMEYLAGESLDARLARGRPSLDEALDVLDQMARALEAAHLHGVVHRDLKPANTFLARVTNEPRPIVKLLDFGLAKLAAGADDRVERTQAGVVIGTAMYLSPEQARGPNVDGRSDVYALGCIAYELVLGARPFPDARSTPALIAAHLHDRPAPPRAIWPEIPAALDLLLFGLLAKDPAYRPTLAQVRQLIAGVRGSSPAAAPVPRLAHLADHAARPRASRPALAALVVLAMLGGALITAISLGRCAPASSPPAPAPAHGARDR